MKAIYSKPALRIMQLESLNVIASSIGSDASGETDENLSKRHVNTRPTGDDEQQNMWDE
jgi:hypothetical protein